MESISWSQRALNRVRRPESGVRHGIGLLLLLLMLLAVTLSAETIADFQYKKVGNVNIQADGIVDAPFLLNLIEITPNVDILTPSKIRKSIELLYQTGNFTNILVNAEANGDQVDLTFILRVIYRFQYTHLKGLTGVSSGKVFKKLRLRKLEPYTPEKALKGREDILSVLNENGYLRARVNPDVTLHRKTKKVEVTYTIESGPPSMTASIQFTGEPHLSVSEISKVMRTKINKQYKPYVLNRDLEFIEGLYDRNGFLEHDIKVVRNELDDTNHQHIEISINAGKQLVLKTDGFKLSSDEIHQNLPIWSEHSYNDDTLEEGKRALIQYLQTKGYYDAAVTWEKNLSAENILITYKIDAGKQYTIGDVKISGNQHLTTSDIQLIMAGEKSGIISKGHLVTTTFESDLNKVIGEYRQRGYLFARWTKKTVNRRDGKLNLDLQLDEGIRTIVSDIRLNGNKLVSTDYFLDRFQQKIGDPISERNVKSDSNYIVSAYSDRGYPQVRVQNNVRLTPDKTHAIIEYKVNEGEQIFVDRIVINGNWRTKRTVVEQNLYFAEDDPLSLRKIAESQRKLYSLEIFDRVEVDVPRPDNLQKQQDVVLRLTETKPYTISYGFGYQTFDLLRGYFAISNRNFLGTGRVIGLQMRGGIREGRAYFNYSDPHLFFKNVNSNINALAESRILPSYSYKEVAAGFQIEKKLTPESAYMEIGSRVPPPKSIFFQYNFEDINTTGTPLLDPVNRQFLAIHISSVTGGFVREGRDNPIDPTHGTFFSTNLQWATHLLGSQSDFVKFFEQFHYYLPVPRQSVFATDVRVGLAKTFEDTNDLPLSQRFFAGGGRTIRGFEQDTAGPLDANGDPLGGNAVIIFNFEYRFPLFGNLGGVTFFDYGNVFTLVSDIDFADLRKTTGIGIRYKTPIGPVAVDWGYKLDRKFEPTRESAYEFFISVGHAF